MRKRNRFGKTGKDKSPSFFVDDKMNHLALNRAARRMTHRLNARKTHWKSADISLAVPKLFPLIAVQRDGERILERSG